MTEERLATTPIAATRHRPAHAHLSSGAAEARWRPVLRFALATGIGAGVTDLVWRHIGTHLSVTTDIVGRTTFADFDIYRYLDRFYDIALVLPVTVVLVYLLIAKFGPLRAPAAVLPWPPALDCSDTVMGLAQRTTSVAVPADADTEAGDLLPLLWVLARIALPAFTIGLEANATRSLHIETLTRFWIVIGLLYTATVVMTGTLLCLRRWVTSTPRDQRKQTTRLSFLQQWITMDTSSVNSIASIVVVPLFVLVSSATTVTVTANGHVAHYPWFPLWFGTAATIIVTIVVVRALRRANDPQSRQRVERRTLFVVVIPILLFMITASLQGAQGPFQAFDDAQSMVGAQLSFGHGLWPWRDLFLLHGFLADDLYGAVGMWVLSPTRWGSNAGLSLFIVPFTIIAFYAFIVYFSRRNRLLMVAGTLALVLELVQGWAITRYVFLPVVLILFDRVLRLGSWRRCILFMASVVFISIVTPEATLIMLGILVTLVLAELIHRPRHEPLARSFSRTGRCIVAGAVLTVVWVLFLISTDSLSGFIAYYQTTISGHELWGAYSPQWSLIGDPWATIEFALPIALFLLTVWKVVDKLRRRSPWRPIEWAIVASSSPVLLFYQVVLDRMDTGHVSEVFQTLIPFVLLWAIDIVGTADGLIVRTGDWLIRRWNARARFPIRGPITIAAVVVIALGSPISLTSWEKIPASFHILVPTNAPSQLPLGYTQPGAVDIAQITDLGKVLDRYAGRKGPVFDFTNEMGVTYFLLNRVPGARFYHVESAQTAKAQNLEVKDLEHSRPHVVIFNDVDFGLPNYDGIWSMERNYLVSQYILDHYRPLLDTHGQLIMLRDDLFANADPLPTLSATPLTSGLYFDMPACDWGYVPNFLVHPTPASTTDQVTLPAMRTGTANLVTVTGWAFDTPDGQPTRDVIAVTGGRVVAALLPTSPRTDVAAALNNQTALSSGFQFQFPVSQGASYQIYTVNSDGSVTPLTSQASNSVGSVVTFDGTAHPIRINDSEGHIDTTTRTASTEMYKLTVPAGTNLDSYQWMEMQSRSGFGHSRIEITNSLTGGPSHIIGLSTLPSVGNSVFTRVGSCLQWHGYGTSQLTLLVHGPAANFSIRLLK